MLPFSKACVLLSVLVATEITATGALIVAEISGQEVEALETILSYMALLALGIIGTFIGFLRYFLNKFNPKNLDPVTIMMVDKVMRESNAGPLLERMEAIEKREEQREERETKIIEVLSDLHAEVKNRNMGSGELYLRAKPSESE